MRLADSEIVRTLPLFRDMQDVHFDALMKAGYLQRFPGQLLLAREAEKPDFLHVVVKGGIELFSESGGRETTLAVLKPPATFILAAVILDQLYLNSARTVVSSSVVLISAAAVRETFDNDRAFARAVVAELAYRYRGLAKELKNQRLRSHLKRLANWVVAHDEECGRLGSFKIPIEKKTLAHLLGMRSENLSRSFSELTKYGVDVDGPTITIRDMAALTAFARPDPLIDDPST
jgi:CRP/FNR family transcriptional regulator, transcriptional activator FtrB